MKGIAKKIFWFKGLTSGMDQATDTSLTDGSQVLKNICTDQPGNWATRKGSDLLKSKIGANQGYGLWDYNSTDGTHKLMAVTDRDLYVLNESTGWGNAVDTDEWVASKKVDGIDFLNRSYIGCESGTDPLAYGTGSTITDVTPTIGGGVLAINKDVLMVGGNSIKPNVILYSDPFTHRFHRTLGSAKADTATCRANADEDGTGYVAITTELFPADIKGAIIYNTTDGAMATVLDWVHGDNTVSGKSAVITDADTSGWNGDTVRVLHNNFKIDGACTASIGYHDNFISFDENNMYIWDPTVQGGFQRKVPNFGSINNRTVAVANGLLVGMSRKGIWLKAGQALPEYINAKIQDRINGYGLWDLISDSNWGEVCMGALEGRGQVWISVGTLSTVTGAPASATAKVVIILDVRTGNWSYRTYQDQITAFSSFINSSGSIDLYGIGKDDSGVWKFETGTTDDNAAGAAQAISYEIRTPHHDLFSLPYRTKVEKYFVKYISAGDVTVQESVNRGSYAALGTLAAKSSVFIQDLLPRTNRMGYSHSLKFTGSGKFILEAYGVLGQKLMPFTGIPAR